MFLVLATSGNDNFLASSLLTYSHDMVQSCLTHRIPKVGKVIKTSTPEWIGDERKQMHEICSRKIIIS